MISLRLEEVEDPVTRENFQRVDQKFRSVVFLKGDWRFITLTFLGPVTNFKVPHGLSFIPKDVIQTATSGVGVAQFNSSLFDKTNLDISTTDACVIRAFVGSYREE